MSDSERRDRQADVEDTHDTVDPRSDRPGSTGEHRLQEKLGTVDRADGFYENAMQSALTDRMAAFLRERWLGFVSGVDAGRPVADVCVGDTGVVRILDDDRVAWPVAAMADRGRLPVAPGQAAHLSLVTVDWWDTTVGLHINGLGRTVETTPERAPDDAPDGPWYVVDIEEAYIHCAKHLPELAVDTPGTVRSAEPSTEHHDRLVPSVRQFISSQVMAFLATADHEGETDISPRLGPAGFVQVIDDETLAWPEYRGNGVHASLGNIAETRTATLTFPDWWNTEAIVEVSGTATLHDSVAGATDLTDADRTKQWVRLDIESVSVTTDPPIPSLSVESFDPPWGTDDDAVKKSGFFTAGE